MMWWSCVLKIQIILICNALWLISVSKVYLDRHYEASIARLLYGIWRLFDNYKAKEIWFFVLARKNVNETMLPYHALAWEMNCVVWRQPCQRMHLYLPCSHPEHRSPSRGWSAASSCFAALMCVQFRTAPWPPYRFRWRRQWYFIQAVSSGANMSIFCKSFRI